MLAVLLFHKGETIPAMGRAVRIRVVDLEGRLILAKHTLEVHIFICADFHIIV